MFYPISLLLINKTALFSLTAHGGLPTAATNWIFLNEIIILFSVLPKPTLHLNLTKTQLSKAKIRRVAALHGAKAVICFTTKITKWSPSDKRKIRADLHQVSKIDDQGHRVQELYNCTGCYISGLLVLGEYVFVIHQNGTVHQIGIEDGTLLQVYQIPDSLYGLVLHTGSLSSNPSLIPDQDQLLLADSNKRTVFTYRLSTRKKSVRIRNISANPSSVSYSFYNNSVFYVVCESTGGLYGNKVSVYDSGWKFLRYVGGHGTRNGQFNTPKSAIVSSDNTIIVADYVNNRLSEFTMEGEFVRQILDSSDGITKPEALSFWSPHLWVVHSDGRLYRYNYY